MILNKQSALPQCSFFSVLSVYNRKNYCRLKEVILTYCRRCGIVLKQLVCVGCPDYHIECDQYLSFDEFMGLAIRAILEELKGYYL